MSRTSWQDSKRRLGRSVLILCALSSLAAVSPLKAAVTSMYAPSPIAYPFVENVRGARDAVLDAAYVANWQVESEQIGEVLLFCTPKAEVHARIAVEYGHQAIRIRFVSSDGMGERKQNGKLSIDSEYNRRVLLLEKEIRSRISKQTER